MSSTASDEQLAKAAQRGDQDAFLELYDRYSARVFNRLRHRVPPQDVEDVMQEVFLAVARSLGSFEQRSRFGTWMYTIMNRQVADFYRRRGRDERLPTVALEDESDEPGDGFQAASVDDRLLLERALNRAPQHYQEVILLRFVDGLSFAEIAERRGQSLEAVKSLFRRAVQSIRDELGEA